MGAKCAKIRPCWSCACIFFAMANDENQLPHCKIGFNSFQDAVLRCLENLQFRTMSTHNIPDGLTHEIYQLYAGGHTTDEIVARLEKRGLDMDMVHDVVKTVRDIRLKRKHSQGLILTGIGAFVLVMAFLITYILSVNGYPTGFTLYGMTTLGIGLLFTGMVLYFG
jgi:hypothetical protein